MYFFFALPEILCIIFFAYIYSMSMSNMRARRPNKKSGTFNFIFYVLQDHYSRKRKGRPQKGCKEQKQVIEVAKKMWHPGCAECGPARGTGDRKKGWANVRPGALTPNNFMVIPALTPNNLFVDQSDYPISWLVEGGWLWRYRRQCKPIHGVDTPKRSSYMLLNYWFCAQLSVTCGLLISDFASGRQQACQTIELLTLEPKTLKYKVKDGFFLLIAAADLRVVGVLSVCALRFSWHLVF